MNDLTNPPTYDRRHGSHDRTDPRYATAGYDVVLSRHSASGGSTVIEILDTWLGDGAYQKALELAKSRRGEGTWAYPAEIYACGCRFAATAVDNGVVLP